MGEIALVVEPQTPEDAEHAARLIAEGRRSVFVDFEKTIGGERGVVAKISGNKRSHVETLVGFHFQ